LQTAMKTHLQLFIYFSFLLIYFRLMPSSAMTDDPSHSTVFIFRSFFTPPPVWLSCESKNSWRINDSVCFFSSEFEFCSHGCRLIEKVHEQVM
jgi:hypothetical protein